jgi:hypothetical protein
MSIRHFQYFDFCYFLPVKAAVFSARRLVLASPPLYHFFFLKHPEKSKGDLESGRHSLTKILDSTRFN